MTRNEIEALPGEVYVFSEHEGEPHALRRIAPSGEWELWQREAVNNGVAVFSMWIPEGSHAVYRVRPKSA